MNWHGFLAGRRLGRTLNRVKLVHVFGDSRELVSVRCGELATGDVVDVECDDGGVELLKRACAASLFGGRLLLRTSTLAALDVTAARPLRDRGVNPVLSYGAAPLPEPLVEVFGTVLRVERLDGGDVAGFLRDRASTFGVSLDAASWQTLVRVAGDDVRVGWSVLRALHAADVEAVDATLFHSLVSSTSGGAPWVVLDALAAGRLADAGRSVGGGLAGFIGYLARTVEDALVETDGGRVRSAGGRHRQLVRRMWPEGKLVEVLTLLDDADRSFKSGRPADAVGVRLVCELEALRDGRWRRLERLSTV